MRKATKLYVLMGVFVVVCIAAFAVNRYEEKKEQIRNSGDVILEVDAESVTALSWTNEDGTYSFTKSDTWLYDNDENFPVDESKINDMLSQFATFTATFTIEAVDDYSQYGLDEPVCTISITIGETSHTIELGDFSKMDEQRYISIGDGNAYLVEHDPLEEYDAVLRDMILDDDIPDFYQVEQIEFIGSENYTIVRDEEAKSICNDDIYFTDSKPLDTDNVESYVDVIRMLDISTYASYNVSETELEEYGLVEPELTINIGHSDDEGTAESITLYVSRNPDEATEYDKAVEDGEETLPDVNCYARVGESQIVYEISQSSYDSLVDASYDKLRHQKIYTTDFTTVTSVEVSLEGKEYTFTLSENDSEESVWLYGEEEIDINSLSSSVQALSADGFISENSSDEKEISLVIHLDNEDFPTYSLSLYRYDGTNCIAVVDGNPIAYVPRSQTVDLIEAVNEIVLGS